MQQNESKENKAISLQNPDGFATMVSTDAEWFRTKTCVTFRKKFGDGYIFKKYIFAIWNGRIHFKTNKQSKYNIISGEEFCFKTVVLLSSHNFY